MNEILLTLFILTNIFGSNNIAYKKPLPQVSQNKFQAAAFDFRSFNVVIKKLPDEVVEKISATNIFIKEIGGAVILDKNAQETRSIASLTKLMTTLIAYQIYEEDEKIKISEKAVKIEGETGFFSVGELFKRNDLIKAALVASSNDAAYALAEKEGIEKFIEQMNLKAKEIGMAETQFFGPTGINSDNKSSLRDLNILSEYIFRNYSEIFDFSKIGSFTLNGKWKRTINNLNYLLPYYKNYIVGSKTGFTTEAGECLILVLKFEKSPFIFLGILNSKNRFEDAEKLILALKQFYE